MGFLLDTSKPKISLPVKQLYITAEEATDKMSVGRFMGMVGALIWSHAEKRYLILKRSGEKDYARNIWECGTGRVDQGETYTQALHREIREELGVEVQIEFIIGTTHFYRGAHLPENEMLGIYYCCTLRGSNRIQLSWEHSEYRWLTPHQVEEFLGKDNWLTKLIHRAERLRSLSPKNLLAFYNQSGFEC
jgi:8-oxo-dGTP diphosphatase